MTVHELIKALIREKDYKTEIVISFDGNLYKLSSDILAANVRQTFKYCVYDYVQETKEPTKRVLVLTKERKNV